MQKFAIFSSPSSKLSFRFSSFYFYLIRPDYKLIRLAVLLVSIICFTNSVNAQVSGTIFKDFNANGTKDNSATFVEVGMPGVVVKATKPDGSALAVSYTGGGAVTNNTGGYSVTGGTLGQIRLEFVMPDAYTFASMGALGGTTIMFPSSATQDLAANYPANYCQSNPQLIVPCYVGQDLTGPNATEPAMARFGYYGNSGEIGSSGYTSPTAVTDHQHLGGTYGVAYSRLTKKVFAGAVLHRHVSYGPLGIGGIYEIDPSTGTVNNWLNIETLTGVDAGTDTRDATTLNSISAAKNYDYASFALVGKTSLGDLEISDDGKVLYVMNVFQQSLVAIDASTKALIGNYPITASALGLTCPQSDFRPWGLKYYKGKLYVGAVCTAQTSQLATDLKAYVLQFDPTNTGAGFSTYFSFPLDYTREQDNWHPWNQTSYNPGSNTDPTTNQRNSQPIFSNIEFDVDGSLIMGFLDRHVMMFSSGNYPPDSTATSTATVTPFPNGDLLRACMTSNGLVLEGGAGCSYNQSVLGGTPVEFYDDRRQGGSGNGNIKEDTGGSLALWPGSTEVVGTGIDELATDENGVGWWNNTNGVRNRAYMLTNKNTAGGQGKTSGLGDIELLCDPAPIEVGNRVWDDTNNNGIQDAGEAGIGGVTVTLCLASAPTTPIATATTDNNGNYYFSSAAGTSTASAIYGITGLTVNTAYQIKFPTTNAGKSLVTANAGAHNIDSDAPSTGIVAFTTGTFGANDHTFDVGYGAVTTTCSLGATVTPGACNPSTNQYTVAVNIVLTNNVSSGTATITDGTTSRTLEIAANATSATLTLAGLTSDGALHTVTVSLPGCGSAVATYNAPVSCLTSQSCTAGVLAYWAFEDCSAGSHTVSEGFVPTYQNSNGCTGLNISMLSRGVSGNSCQERADGTLGVCMGSSDLPSWVDNSSKSLSFTMTYPVGSVGRLSSIDFETMTPTYVDNHLNGSTGTPNDYPTKWGIRVLKNGVEIYKSIDNALTVDTWVQQHIDWSTDPNFAINGATTFTFEINGYAPVGITSATRQVWDLDEVKVSGYCGTCTTCSLAVTATPSPCTPATNQYSVSGSITLTNNTAGGTATITDGTATTTVSVAPNATTASYTLTGINTDGTGHTVTVVMQGCGTASTAYQSPTSCLCPTGNCFPTIVKKN